MEEPRFWREVAEIAGVLGAILTACSGAALVCRLLECPPCGP